MRMLCYRIGMLALVASLALLGAACGGGAATPAPTGAPSKPAAAEPTKAAAPAPAQPAAQPTKAAAAAPAQKAPPIELKLAYHEAQTSSSGIIKAYNRWAEMVGEKTDGRIKVNVFGGETLAKGRDMYPAIQNGIADIGWVVVAFFPGQFPLTEALNLPMLGVDSSLVGSRAIWDLYQNNQEVQKEWSKVHVITLYSSGVQSVYTAKKAVRTADDLKGLKLRVTGYGATQLMMALGASPIQMAPPDMYESVNKGIIDGFVFDWAGVVSEKLWDVVNYNCDLPFVVVPQAFVMNQNKWNSLPPDLQAKMNEISGEFAAEMFAQGFDGDDPGAKEKFKSMGKEIIPFSAEEAAKWQAPAKSVWDGWAKQVADKGLDGNAAVSQLEEAIAKAKKQ